MSLFATILRFLGLGNFGRGGRRNPPRPLPAERVTLVERLDASPFGVNCHTARPELLRTLCQGGIRWYRLDVDWDLIEPNEGNFEWRDLDACVAELRAQGVALLGSIAYTPTWASGGDANLPRIQRQGLMPRDPNRFLSFIDAVLERYPEVFHALAIWNEPNQPYFRGTRQEYLTRLLRPGLERLASRASGIVRCGPDLSSSPQKNPLEWLDAALDVAGDLIDVVTHHQYDGDERVDRRVESIVKVRELIERKGLADRPLWITETGWKRGEVSDAQQGERLAGMFSAMGARASWWKKTFWFDSHGPGEGLLGADKDPDPGRPFPVFDRYAVTIAQTQQRDGARQA